jgi:serine/threonine-protein kinase
VLGAVLAGAGLAATTLRGKLNLPERAIPEAPRPAEATAGRAPAAEAVTQTLEPFSNAPVASPAAPKNSSSPRTPLSESVLAARLILRSAVARRDWVHAVPAFVKLVDISPASFRDAQVVSDSRDLATAIAMGSDEAADGVFSALATRLGADGLDVLYEILRARGGTKAAARAEAFLRQPAVLASATPTMRISFEFRVASCDEKAKLLDRAVAEGDGRTLTALEVTGASCLGNSPALRQALKDLRAKLRQ